MPNRPAGGGSAPEAPIGLTVNDRERHLSVEGAPRFGWLPQDRDGNEIQTAYQVRVLGGGGDEVIWDSGKVASRRQSYVRYDGPSSTPAPRPARARAPGTRSTSGSTSAPRSDSPG